jgi:cysteine-rich repeat protein
LVATLSVASCGGGTTGHEDLDVRTPPAGTSTSRPIDQLPDAAPTEDVIDASVAVDMGGVIEASVDMSVRVDSSLDGAGTSGDASDSGFIDTARVREGAVVRDTPLFDPTDVSGDARDAALDLPPPTVCGDGKKEGNEECDDGNKLNADGCSAICTDTRKCDDCLAINCSDPFYYSVPIWPLCSQLKGNAMNGEGAGRPRQDLCQEVYTCIIRTQCIDWTTTDPTPCFCGTTDRATCVGKPKAATGPCVAEIQNGVESEDPAVAGIQFTNQANASGAAFSVRQCARDLCEMECNPNTNRDGGTSDAGPTTDAPGGG